MKHIHWKIACATGKTMQENGIDFVLHDVLNYSCIAKNEKGAMRKAKKNVHRKYYFSVEAWECTKDDDLIVKQLKQLEDFAKKSGLFGKRI